MGKKRKQRLCRICKKCPVWVGGDVKNPQATCKRCYHAHVWPEREKAKQVVAVGRSHLTEEPQPENRTPRTLCRVSRFTRQPAKVAGTIGTALSRFQIAAQTASSVADVSQAAEARITDADVADNSPALVRSQILQQAASAVLAQANQQPTLALTLLR